MGEDFSKVIHKGIKPDVLDGKGKFPVGVFFPPPLCLADPDPVGGLVAGADEAFGFDEGFEEHRGIVVALLTVLLDSSGRHAEQHGSEIFRLDPGEDQETGVVDDELEIFLLQFSGPADPGVPGGDLPGGSGSPRECA